MIYEYIKNKMQEHLSSIVYDQNNIISYSELLNYAETMGEILKKFKQQKFGILCRSNLNSAKNLLMCFYAGKTAVMLSQHYGEKHNKKIIKKIGLTHIITDNGIESLPETNIAELDDLTDVALIMCTSGTTGTPKGAMITHENLIANLNDIGLYFKITNKDKILIIRPLYHCAVLTGEFLISLIRGLEIVFSDIGFNPVNILKIIKKHEISVMCGTPTMFFHIGKSIGITSDSHLKIIAVSGECMTETVAKCARKAFPFAKIYNVYGLTEASPRVCYLPPELFDKYPLSVGFPLSNLKTKIKNNELLVKGKSVMKGYYNDPEATKKVLKRGWLHTGDIAEVNRKGIITIKSRKDDMIIRAGINIYPQEIENALKQDERIKDIVVFGKENETAGQKICVKVVTDNLSKADIYNICKKLLPLYQLPDIIEIEDEIPKNASGKIMRRAS